MPESAIPEHSSSTLVQHIADTIKSSSTIRYCFILGAGASKTSGIRTGDELAAIWFEDIKRVFRDEHEEWTKTGRIDISDLGSSYSKIYEKRFELNPVEGYEFIQTEIARSKPSYGYSVLARLLKTQHNVVITTNFDPLTEDALFIYTENRPLVCGHESLSEFVRPTTNRPVIIKVHRDQLLAPISSEGELTKLQKGFKESLDRILQTYKPIVIGYGGNDPSLMDYLKDCNHLNGIFWCKRKGDKLSDRITDLLRSKGGKIFEIPGFDELMFQIHAAIYADDQPLNEMILENSKARAEEWGRQYAELSGRLAEPESKAALSEIVKERPFKTWWDVQAAVNATEDIEARDEIYLKGLEQFAESPELTGNYALFLETIGKDYDEAEKYYIMALEHDPDNAINNRNYAILLKDIRKDYDEAEKCYLKALELDPDDAYNNGHYALFLKKIRKDYDGAEKYYLKALELDPNNATIIGNYALFLATIRRDYDQAVMYYLKALERAPDNGDVNGNYAQFLIGRGKLSEARTYIDRAFANTQSATQALLPELWFYRFANFYSENPGAEKELKKLITAGARSAGWDFTENIEQARKQKHPKMGKVIEYAEIISGNKYSAP